MTTVEPGDEPEGRVSPEGPNAPVPSESEERLGRSDDRSEEDVDDETNDQDESEEE